MRISRADTKITRLKPPTTVDANQCSSSSSAIIVHMEGCIIMMRAIGLKVVASTITIISLSYCIFAQDIDTGKMEYQANCASCHGIDAKGAGPVSTVLKTRPSDLTVLTKNNNGVFPLNSLQRIIDGRDAIASHGTREMPVWGYRFVPPSHYSLKLTDDYLYSAPASPEAIVQARILAVIDYLNRIQEK